MTTTDPPPRPPTAAGDHVVVRVSSPGDLLAVVPYQLGYVPERSLVVLTLRGTSLFCVGRVDLPPATTSGREVAAEVLGPLARHRFDGAVVVTVEDALAADPGPDGDADGPRRSAPRSWTDLAREVCAGLRRQGVEVQERITVRGGWWWHPDGTARERRPQRVPGPADVPALAEYVVRGRAPLRRREDLVALVRPGPGATASEAAVDDLVRRFEADGAERRFLRRSAVTAWARLVAGAGGSPDPGRAPGRDPGLPTGDVPLLVASAHDVRLRDLLLAWLCPDGATAVDHGDPELSELAGVLAAVGTGDAAGQAAGDLGPGHLVALLTRLARASPPGRGAPVLGVLGHVAWWHGDGTLARVAVDAALEQDPGHTLAVLLAQLLDLAVAPRRVA